MMERDMADTGITHVASFVRELKDELIHLLK
jgi:hypothetical protein